MLRSRTKTTLLIQGVQKDPIREAPSPSNSPKNQRMGDSSVAKNTNLVTPKFDSPRVPEAALPLIGSFARLPPPPGLVSSANLDLLLKDTTRFIMEFEGYAGMPINSIMIGVS